MRGGSEDGPSPQEMGLHTAQQEDHPDDGRQRPQRGVRGELGGLEAKQGADQAVGTSLVRPIAYSRIWICIQIHNTSQQLLEHGHQ